MQNFQEILKKKPYPKFIKNHLIFKAFPNIEKVFPKIGLTNSYQKFNPTLEDLAESYLLNLATKIQRHVHSYLYVRIPQYYSREQQEVIISINVARTKFIWIANQIKRNPKSFVKINGKSISFELPKSYKGHKAGSDLYEVINSFNTVNYPGFNGLIFNFIKFDAAILFPNTRIVFSSEGNAGTWDLATMSMRGISSCMRWNNVNSRSLVGSLADPFTGLIYLASNNKTKYGPKMIARAVVRFVLRKSDNKPFLFLEGMYPREHAHAILLQSAFINFLKDKTDNKFEVVTKAREYFIPQSEVVDYLDEDNRSYRDSRLIYKANKKFRNVSTLKL